VAEWIRAPLSTPKVTGSNPVGNFFAWKGLYLGYLACWSRWRSPFCPILLWSLCRWPSGLGRRFLRRRSQVRIPLEIFSLKGSILRLFGILISMALSVLPDFALVTVYVTTGLSVCDLKVILLARCQKIYKKLFLAKNTIKTFFRRFR
jgi:hypothetical protein